ncbi:MAG: hypothetical protein HY616_11815 [Candidatus Rokubacteria bacterium]|nr:hypothetical protein [Candidatus Rokubacteria bacterium]MBI4255749.1 hypothetical protein [Candidatus Rokubacteria bacterium]
MSVRRSLAAVAAAAALALAGGAAAAPSDDRILPVPEYTSEKAKNLAVTHLKALRALNGDLYHCVPWVEVQRHSIGFFRPKHIARDDRYLSVRIYIEQDPSPQFAALRVEQRAGAMFSRYVGALLKRMTQDRTLAADPSIDGFTVILEWLKQAPRAAGARPVHETIAVFVEKPLATDYLAGRLRTREVAERAKVLGFDGETALGELRLTAWDDNFVATYKVANYEVEKGITCQ